MKTEKEIKRILENLYDERFQISFNTLLDADNSENQNMERIKLSVEIEKINAQICVLEDIIGYKYEPLKEKIFKISSSS